MSSWIYRLKKGHMLSIITSFLIIIICLVAVLINRQRAAKQASENSYNMSFYELVNYVQNVEAYLAKSVITSTPEHGAETLTNLCNESNLAQICLSQLPIESQELQNTSKFLNQVSDYSYSLSRKNIYKEALSDEDLKNLKELHSYSVELENTLNQLSEDINSGRVHWNELENKGKNAFAQQVSTDSFEGLSALEQKFHEYSGLIYDGAFSDHLLNAEMKGLIGDDIDEEYAKQVAIKFVGEDKIEQIDSLGYSENASIPEYDFYIRTFDDNNINISISKKGGHVISMNSNREVSNEVISQEDANERGKEFLNTHDFHGMKETYYLKRDGIVTINYAYTQDDVVVYSDLIKVKVALDNGEILGIETTGYLNNHTQRDVSNIKISKEKAKEVINENLDVLSEGLAIIPTEFKTEILCYEFKGKVDDREFLIYINSENGRVENDLIIKNTPNGVLTM